MKRTLADLVVPPGATLREAMRCIDRNVAGIALVADADGRLLDTVTDGDIRRALLAGAGLDSPLAVRAGHRPFTVGPAAGRAEVLDLMRARGIEQVPIVDADGRLHGLHILREVVGARVRPNAAVIMAGGRGERLRPLTDTVPKPMIPVAGKPILERLVLHLVGHGIREIHLSINYLGHLIRAHFGDGSAFGCAIRYLEEDRPLGTGGALSLLPRPPECALLVMNGDLVTQADLGAMLDQHGRAGDLLTVGVQEYSHTIPFGCLRLEGGRVTGLEEKPVVTRAVNAGIYALDPRVVARVPRGENFPIINLIEQCLALGEPVGAFHVAAEWTDVGQVDQLRRAREGS